MKSKYTKYSEGVRHA